MSASPKSVCVPCRRVFKGSGHSTVPEDKTWRNRRQWPLRWTGTGAGMHRPPDRCPECRGEVIYVDASWRPPRRTNDQAWKKVAKGELLTEDRPRARLGRGHHSGRSSKREQKRTWA